MDTAAATGDQQERQWRQLLAMLHAAWDMRLGIVEFA
jgi:hypothetical protein